MSSIILTLFALLMAMTIHFQHTHGMKCRSDDDSSEQEPSFLEIVQSCQDEEQDNGRDQDATSQDKYRGRSEQRSETEHRNSRKRYDVEQSEGGNQDNGRNDNRRNDHGRNDNGRNDHGRNDNGRNDNGRNDNGRSNQGEHRNQNDRQNSNRSNNDQRRDGRYNQSLENRFAVQSQMGTEQSRGQGGYRNSTVDGDNGFVDIEQLDPCTVHCIFRHMRMLDRRGLPDKAAMVSVMSRGIHDRHVQRFVGDAIEECHEIVRADFARDRCRFAQSLALCFQEKGRRTCDDWDEPSPPTTGSRYPYYKQY